MNNLWDRVTAPQDKFNTNYMISHALDLRTIERLAARGWESMNDEKRISFLRFNDHEDLVDFLIERGVLAEEAVVVEGDG